MAAKRGHSPELIPNPFIKKRNLEWTIALPAAVTASSSPSRSSSSEDSQQQQQQQQREDAIDDHDSDSAEEEGEGEDKGEEGLSAAAVEAGEVHINDHLNYFSQILTKAALAPFPPDAPRLSIERYRALYGTSFGSSRGAHFVVHQHDHPIAGTHYDLRLQINETSSASWAIMYGLPGDPNSKRLNRNATETRVHCLWNHLIETASPATGSLLIWDTGTYTILPPNKADGSSEPAKDPSSQQSPSPPPSPSSPNSESESESEQAKLQTAFASRKIRIQLHGSRLPPTYVLNLRLTQNEDAAGRARGLRAPSRRRRRGGRTTTRGGGRGGAAAAAAAAAANKQAVMNSSGSDCDNDNDDDDDDDDADIGNAQPEKGGGGGDGDGPAISAMEREIRELGDEQVRRTNAYPGADNTVGSVHQRRWYASLDREACGFVKHRRGGRVIWEPSHGAGSSNEGAAGGGGGGDGGDGGGKKRFSFPFYVRGVEVERSVVTGRLGAEVLRDGGVVGYVSRKGWRPVLN